MALAYAQILLKEAQQLPGSITNNDTTFFEALQTFAERASDALRALDEHHAVGPTGIGFESERAGPREEIEHRAALERTEGREKRLAHAIGRRPDAVGNAPEVTAAEMTADDSHGSGLHLLDTSTTYARIAIASAVGNDAAA